MEDKLFIDTNILAYYMNTDSQFHDQVKNKFNWISENYELWISRQILREYAVVISHPGFSDKIVTPDIVADDLVRWESNFNVADETEEVTKSLVELIRKYKISGKKIHDANIVATMLANKISSLYTFNQDDFIRFKEIQLFALKK